MPQFNSFTEYFLGTDVVVPRLDGTLGTYINFDNAASTPPLKSVRHATNDFLEYYSSVHRGTGYKSQLSTHLYEQARETVLQFLGADSTEHTCIFGKNTTEAINKLARRFPFTPERNLVLTTAMEHHSDDLPWREAAEVVHVPLTRKGRLDRVAFEELLKTHRDQVALVAITGASNVTGFVNPIHELATLAHEVGA